METVAKPALLLQRAGYYVELTKPRILLLVLMVVIVAMFATGIPLGIQRVMHTCVGVALLAASASVMNQWAERDRDALMRRTSKRPLPSGRVAESEAAWMGLGLAIGGSIYLSYFVNVAAALSCILTWGLYVWVYTPLKTLHWSNTLVGTIPGALPVITGWLAADGSLWSVKGWSLFGILVAWQLPHFMGIAHLYAQQYEAAGFRMITSSGSSGRGAALHAAAGAIGMLLLLPLVITGNDRFVWIFLALALLAGFWQLGTVIQYARTPTDATARRMLHVSFLSLPIILAMTLVNELAVRL